MIGAYEVNVREPIVSCIMPSRVATNIGGVDVRETVDIQGPLFLLQAIKYSEETGALHHLAQLPLFNRPADKITTHCHAFVPSEMINSFRSILPNRSL